MSITRRTMISALVASAAGAAVPTRERLLRTRIKLPGGISSEYLKQIVDANSHFPDVRFRLEYGLNKANDVLVMEVPAKTFSMNGPFTASLLFPSGPEQMSNIPYIAELNPHAISIALQKFFPVYDTNGRLTSSIGMLFRAEEV